MVHYTVKITFVKDFYHWQNSEVFHYKFPSEYNDKLIENIKLYSSSFKNLFRELVYIVEPLDIDIQEYEDLGIEEVRLKLKDFQEKCIYLESAKDSLEQQVLDLSETKLSLDDLKNQVEEIKRNAEYSQNYIDELNAKLEHEKSYIHQLISEEKTLYSDLNTSVQACNDLSIECNFLKRQVADLSNFKQDNEKLQKSKNVLEEQFSSIEKELRETQQKLTLATTRLHQQTVKPGIAGGGDRSDQLKNDFANLKMGSFRDASSQVLKCWQKQDSTITFRSEEFSKIRSILSQRVFTDGMSYFSGDTSEVDTTVESIMNELTSVEDLNLTQSISQIIQRKIETALLSLKGIDNSDEALNKYVETATQIIIEDLQKIRDFFPAENVLQELKNFVGAGLKLVREIVNNLSPGEFYTPENDVEFDENLHDTRESPEGKIKLTICAGYRIPGTILTKADVIMYVSETATASMTETPLLKDGDSTDEAKQSDISKRFHAVVFSGKVTPAKGVYFQTQPHQGQEYKSQIKADYNSILEFDTWTHSDEIKIKKQDLLNSKWYKISGQNYWWVPAAYIEGEPPNLSSSSTNEEDRSCEEN